MGVEGWKGRDRHTTLKIKDGVFAMRAVGFPMAMSADELKSDSAAAADGELSTPTSSAWRFFSGVDSPGFDLIRADGGTGDADVARMKEACLQHGGCVAWLGSC